MTKIIHYFSFFLLVSLSSCEYLYYLDKETEETSTSFEISEFKNIIVEAPYKIVFIEEAHNFIRFEGQEHILKDINTKVIDGTLYLDHHKSRFIQKNKRPTVYLHANQLQKITLNNICSLVTEEQLMCDNLIILINGRGSFSESDINVSCSEINMAIFSPYQVGDHYLRGECHSLYITLEGNANVFAEDLASKNGKVYHRSSGKCIVAPLEKLHVDIYASGNTYYYNKPELSSEKIENSLYTPSGEVFQLND